MLWNDFVNLWPNSCNGEGAQIDNKWSTMKVTPSGRGAGEVFGIGDVSSVLFFAGSLQQFVWNELKPGCHQKPNETSRAGVNSLILFVLFQTCMLRVLPELSIITQMIAIDSCNRRRGHADIGRFGLGILVPGSHYSKTWHISSRFLVLQLNPSCRLSFFCKIVFWWIPE